MSMYNVEGFFSYMDKEARAMFLYKGISLRMVHNMNHLYQRLGVLGERLSTGQRINRAADDPAGLAISEKMRAQIRGIRQAQRNAQDGISLMQVAEGAMNEIHAMLQRMREISIQASNGTYQNEDRALLDLEFQQLKEGIESISRQTQFNTKCLLDGGRDGNALEINLQVGANSGDMMKISINSMTLESLGLENASIDTLENAQSSIALLDQSIGKVSQSRSSLGAMHNRLEHTIRYLENYEENLTAAESRIRDVDMAQTMMEYIKTQITLEVAQAVFAHTLKMEQRRVRMLLEAFLNINYYDK